MILRSPRRGFTLLEMILALAIGLVLMTALYMMLSSQLSHSQVGRESIQEATLARSILARLSNDIVGSLGAYDPSQVTDTASSSETTEDTVPAGKYVQCNFGLQGDASQLVLIVGRVPREILGSDKRQLDSGTLSKVSDLRRIAYWVAEGQGLVQQEVARVTSTEIDTTPPDVDGASKFAPEVKSISFQYWDGDGGWISSWDSTIPGTDGETLIGSPAAVEITIELGRNKYRHVVSVPTGNNYSMQTTQ